MLEVRGLRKRYGDIVALDGLDLDVTAGEICGLLGPNGAGKTTMVSIVAALLRADAGSVRVNGIDVAGQPYEARRFLGLAPQELGIYPTVGVRDNLVFFAELADLRGADLERGIDEVAEALELTELLGRPARTLSGGEKRRLHTALAMLGHPPLLLLDEPTTGVDVRTRARVLEAVGQLAAQHGTAICYSTHYLPEVEGLGASVAIIEDGRIIARGSLGELIGRHGTAAVELTFDGSPPVVDLGRPAERDGDRLRIPSEDPTADAAVVLGRLGPEAAHLRAIEIVKPSLETVFLALTGRRYDAESNADDADDELESSRVVAP